MELISSDTDSGNKLICRNNDSEVKVSMQRSKSFQFEYNIESGEYFLKEIKEISIDDVKCANKSYEYDEYLNSGSENESRLYEENQENRQRKFYEYSFSSKQTDIVSERKCEVAVPTKPFSISNVEHCSVYSSEFKSHSEEQKVLMSTDEVEDLKDVPEILNLREIRSHSGFLPTITQQTAKQHSYQQKVPRNGAYEIVEINNEFMCGVCPFKNHLEAIVKLHFDNYHSHEFNLDYQSNKIDSSNEHSIIQENKLFKCSQCNFKTKYKKYLKLHAKKIHSGECQFYKCHHCEYRTKDKKNFNYHLSRHYVLYQCSHCNYCTKYSKLYKQHQIVHRTFEESELFKCLQCDCKFKRKQSLKKHLETIHSDKKIFKCSNCDFETKHKESLKEHAKRHSDECQLYKCDFCDYNTKYKNDLKVHLIMHSDNPVLYQCKHCSYCTKYSRLYKQHQIVHRTFEESELFKCLQCGCKFKRKQSLKKHLETIHSDKKIFKCSNCDFETKHKESLKEHAKRHSDECQLYKCDFCDYKTKYKNYLKVHLIMHSDNPVLYQCKHCDFSTKRSSSYRAHQVVHRTLEESELFKCPNCDYKAKQKRYVKAHLKIHINN